MKDSENQAVGRQGQTISLRASHTQKVLIDRAAKVLGKSRSNFILDTACREAETVLLDRRYVALSREGFERFTSLLDTPPARNQKLRRFLRSKAMWDK